MRQHGVRKPLNADESPKAAFNATSAGFWARFRQLKPVPLRSTVSNRRRQAFPGAVRAEAFAKSHQPASRASGPSRNFRTHSAPNFTLTFAIRASRWPYACPPATRRRPPSCPDGRSQTIATPACPLPFPLIQVVCLRPFYAHRHLTVCCSLVRHRADFKSEIKNRASVSLLPFPHCHGFSFRWDLNALPRTASLSPNQVKRAANGRVTDSGSKKSYENNTFKN